MFLARCPSLCQKGPALGQGTQNTAPGSQPSSRGQAGRAPTAPPPRLAGLKASIQGAAWTAGVLAMERTVTPLTAACAPGMLGHSQVSVGAITLCWTQLTPLDTADPLVSLWLGSLGRGRGPGPGPVCSTWLLALASHHRLWCRAVHPIPSAGRPVGIWPISCMVGPAIQAPTAQAGVHRLHVCKTPQGHPCGVGGCEVLSGCRRESRAWTDMWVSPGRSRDAG